MSKISEKEKRLEIIDKLKQKILKEIDKFNTTSRDYFADILENNTTDLDLYFGVGREVCIYGNIYYFIKRSSSFLNFEMLDRKNDKVVYSIRDETLLCWLHKDFNWCKHWIDKFGLETPSERDLEINLMSTLETILYTEV